MMTELRIGAMGLGAITLMLMMIGRNACGQTQTAGIAGGQAKAETVQDDGRGVVDVRQSDLLDQQERTG